MHRRKKLRKSKNAAIYLFVSIILIVLLGIFGLSVFMKIMEIEVAGASYYTGREIIEASGILAGDNIMFLDTSTAAERILTEKPYISEVRIESVPPTAIRITVSESVPVASIRHRNEALLIDSSGRVLDKWETAPGNLIEIRGFTPLEAEVGSMMRAMSGSETQLRSLADVLQAFERAGILGDVTYLDVEHISTISFGYIGRFTVILGGATNVSHKLNQLPGSVSWIDEEKPGGVTGVINMSDASGEYRFIEDR